MEVLLAHALSAFYFRKLKLRYPANVDVKIKFINDLPILGWLLVHITVIPFK